MPQSSLSPSNSAIADRPAPAPSRGGKYLTFALGREEYGVEILRVREIIGRLEITGVPRTPPEVKGVINLRGQVISVVDLRAKFGMEPVEPGAKSCIVIVETERNGRPLNTGIIVDRVTEVLHIPAEAIEDAPDFGAGVRTDFIVGLGKVGDSVKILLNVDRVLDRAEEFDRPCGPV